MTDALQPFHRLDGAPVEKTESAWLIRLIRLHLAFVAVVLLLGSLGLLWYMYTLHLRTIDVSWNLRITRAGKLYEAGSQVKLLLVLALAFASIIQFRAVKGLGERTRSALTAVRLAAIMLLAGFPLSWLAWRTELNIPGAPAGIMRVAAAALAAQSIVALLYVVFLFLPVARRAFAVEQPAPNSALRRVQRVGLGLWLLTVAALAVTLGVATDWLVELPVPRPEPGELLYATTFEAATDEREWDLYGGRDAAQVINVDSGRALAITYGSPYMNEVVFSLLNRKFNDMDLRVTAQHIAGPDDNQYGVVFRYRDRKNYYGFFISSDGYYSLVKRQNGELTDISAWGRSDVIRQGDTANEIRILAHGDSFRFYINGQLMPLCLRGVNKNSMWAESEGPGVCFAGGELTTIYRDSSFGQGRIALAAGTSIDLSGDVVVAFDDLIVVGPDPDSVIAAPGEG